MISTEDGIRNAGACIQNEGETDEGNGGMRDIIPGG